MHGSDSVDNGEREAGLWFQVTELIQDKSLIYLKTVLFFYVHYLFTINLFLAKSIHEMMSQR